MGDKTNAAPFNKKNTEKKEKRAKTFYNLTQDFLNTEKTYQKNLTALLTYKNAILKLFTHHKEKVLFTHLFQLIEKILALTPIPFEDNGEMTQTLYAQYGFLYSKITAFLKNMTAQQKIALQAIHINGQNSFENLITQPIEIISKYMTISTTRLKNAPLPDREKFIEENNKFQILSNFISAQIALKTFLSKKLKLSTTDFSEIIKTLNNLNFSKATPIVFDFATFSANTHNAQLRIMFALYTQLSKDTKKNIYLTPAVKEAMLSYQQQEYDSHALIGKTLSGKMRTRFFVEENQPAWVDTIFSKDIPVKVNQNDIKKIKDNVLTFINLKEDPDEREIQKIVNKLQSILESHDVKNFHLDLIYNKKSRHYHPLKNIVDIFKRLPPETKKKIIIGEHTVQRILNYKEKKYFILPSSKKRRNTFFEDNTTLIKELLSQESALSTDITSTVAHANLKSSPKELKSSKPK